MYFDTFLSFVTSSLKEMWALMKGKYVNILSAFPCERLRGESAGKTCFTSLSTGQDGDQRDVQKNSVYKKLWEWGWGWGQQNQQQQLWQWQPPRPPRRPPQRQGGDKITKLRKIK